MSINIDSNVQLYTYNQSANRLLLKDGTEDSFCHFFNGETLAEDDVILKADVQKRETINEVIKDIKRYNTWGLTSKEIWDLKFESYNPFQERITINEGFSVLANYCLDPKKFETETDSPGSDYTYLDNITYTKENAISLVPGSKFKLNGLDVKIVKNEVKITDADGRDITKNEAYLLSDCLDKLIRCANDQFVASDIYSENMGIDVLQLLRDLGINIKENFIINGCEFTIKEDRIFAVDQLDNPLSYLGLTKRQLDIAIKKYENSLLSIYS